ncbi:helix-turn-helix domain-containing protein [Thiomonas sp. FB-Cd]|uniref:helix-turn-helix domain-containing protein n=1 Tax=Thiomonas sp. FB-Cd TaxID=1158292 RepID=UPI0004DEE60D|nr:helix-turn-helix domain-containing protein [Thiomonas sp. FB-Cd]
MNNSVPAPSYSLTELCSLADVPLRTARYYVQIGLVDRPQGETRAAHYDGHHLEQLLQARKWAAAGVSLERIRGLLHGEPPPVPSPQPSLPGTVEVRSHITVAQGIELVVEPARAGLDPAQLRALVRGAVELYGRLTDVLPRQKQQGEDDV